MPVQFHNGKVLFTLGGSVAMDPACCCAPTTCCANPPEEMLLTPSDHWSDVNTPPDDSLVSSPGGGGDDGVCEQIRDAGPYTLAMETLANPLPTTPCSDIHNWKFGLPGAAVANWFLLIEDFGEFYCTHFPGIPPSIPPADFGCCDLEGETVALLLQLALRTIPNETTGEPECWYFAQVAWYTDNTTPQVCRWYNFEGTAALNTFAGSTCQEFVTPYSMEFNPTDSSETVPGTPTDPCWGCALAYDPPTTVPVVVIDTVPA